MIKQIEKIPRRAAPPGLNGMFLHFDVSLRQLSRHFDLCLNALNEPVRRARLAEAARPPSPRSFNRVVNQG